MPRPKGRPLPQSHIEAIRRARLRQGRWERAFTPIRQAADAGNERLAVRLLREYIRNRKQEAA